MKIKNIYYFGNPYIESDSLMHIIVPTLKEGFSDIGFVHIKNTFDLLDIELDNCLILDVADSVSNVELIRSNMLKPGGTISAHDFDLGYFFEITGKKSLILAIPMNYSPDKAVSESTKFINQILLQEA